MTMNLKLIQNGQNGPNGTAVLFSTCIHIQKKKKY